ncbi:MAG: helix-turn-helix transcriptional regulator [bacterium]|nr:helix-turn-helix transcriptional regulator [bacterium]
MEFHEKLQELRKSRGMTQEELAEALFVSRTAISKWESGRGYPSIDSLKEISNYFSVSIDDLLSGEKLISIAEKENRSNIRGMCDLLFGIMDLFSLTLIFLPLYPNPVDGYIYSVNLFSYVETTVLNRIVYWTLFLILIAIGAVKVVLSLLRITRGQKAVTGISIGISVLTVLFLAMAGEPYAITVAFLLLLVKGIILMRSIKASN